MKVLIVFALIALGAAEEFFTTGDDYIDVDAFFANKPRTKAFLDCYLDRGECPELAASYKRIMPEAIATACRRCNDAQKHIYWKFLQGLKAMYPEEYQNYRKKYDPDNKYIDALEKAISIY